MPKKQTFTMKEEFAGLDCNPSRLEKRFARTVETLSAKPDKPVWFCGGNRAEAEAGCRMPDA